MNIPLKAWVAGLMLALVGAPLTAPVSAAADEPTPGPSVQSRPTPPEQGGPVGCRHMVRTLGDPWQESTAVGVITRLGIARVDVKARLDFDDCPTAKRKYEVALGIKWCVRTTSSFGVPSVTFNARAWNRSKTWNPPAFRMDTARGGWRCKYQPSWGEKWMTEASKPRWAASFQTNVRVLPEETFDFLTADHKRTNYIKRLQSTTIIVKDWHWGT